MGYIYRIRDNIPVVWWWQMSKKRVFIERDVKVSITPLGKRIFTMDIPTKRDECECGMTIDEAEKACLYVNQDCKSYCIRNAMNERGEPYE
jgi:hypothetical protein